MVKSKKILCLILAVLILMAVSALCALGVGAEDLTISQFSLFTNEYELTSRTTSLPLSSTFTRSFSYLGVRINFAIGSYLAYNTDYYFTASFSCTYPLSSDIYLTYPISNFNDNFIDSSTLEMVPTATGYDISFVFNRPSNNSGTYSLLWFYFKYPSTITNTNVTFVLNSLTVSTDIPEPEPDDEDFTFLEPTYFSYNQKVPSYTNVTEKNNPAYYDWEIPNLHSLTLPTPKQLNEDALFLMFYAGGDYEEFFDPYTVVSGQLQILIENDRYIDLVNSNGDFQGTIESTVSRLIQNGHVWITNHEVDPTNSEFQYFEVPTTWDLRSQLWQYPESRYLTQFVYDFYFVVPDDISTLIGFNPFNIMIYLDPIIQVDSTSISIQNLENYYSFNYYSIRYWHRNSSESPLPDPYTPVDNSDDVQIQDAVDGTSGYKWEYDQTMDYYDPNLEYANDVFDLSSLASTFNTLYSSLIYSGTDFHFYLPASGVVPFLNATLWQQTEIPLKYYIDALPNPVIVVIRFLAWGGVAMGFFLTAKTLLSDINGGNKDESSS